MSLHCHRVTLLDDSELTYFLPYEIRLIMAEDNEMGERPCLSKHGSGQATMQCVEDSFTLKR
eukprot:scaffold1835_cov141-Skeletonema_marinoi.AAC.2